MDRSTDEFCRLFDEHHLPLFRFACRLTGSVADAEDIVQECFLQLVRPGNSYDATRTNVRTYLFGVVRNQALKRLQKRQPPNTSSNQESPETVLLNIERAGLVSRAVADLPETQREILILAHYEQIPLAEIAEITGLNLGAVKSRLQRARSALKESLASYVTESQS